MSKLRATDFRRFFEEMYDREPFPWQERLARRVLDVGWPACIALPTAAGKTACIDIAVFALACQAERPAKARDAARRIFFVVDRRVVVDQAYERAKKLAMALADPKTVVAKQVAEALKRIAQSDRALDFYALRGGMYRENTWVRSPLQPTIITTTVDQFGSRMLFRGYGVSDSLRPVHAALVSNDSLILLDEAHCARPFNQTMALIERYRDWADEPLRTSFHFVTMTATPSADFGADDIERDSQDDHNHPVLGPRIKACKPAQLVVAEKAKGGKWRSELVKTLTTHAQSLSNDVTRAVGVIVNRVATARQTAAALRRENVDVVLLTGRMRPLDRDLLLKKLEPLLSGNSGELNRPTYVVATQCLEVGADLDFHALVTECASLDALRQRFGRLNRVAARADAAAVIIVRSDQTEPADDVLKQDPVYGNSLANTWRWLQSAATSDVFDFGVAAVRAKTEYLTAEDLAALNAPTADAAVLLPAHMDCFVQTSPIPAPDPDPAVFLHGPASGVPDVQVVFRADLGADERKWTEIVSLCPPSSTEGLPVRMDVFKRWLAGQDVIDESSDIEGDQGGESTTGNNDIVPVDRLALRWAGPDSKLTDVIRLREDVRPGDLYVVPIATDTNLSSLGDFPDGIPSDQGDEAFQRARDNAILRLTSALFTTPSLADMEIDDESPDVRLSEAIESLTSDPREWVRRAAASFKKKRNRVVKPHPLGGLVVTGRKRLHLFDPTFVEAEESWESLSDRPVLLEEHCGAVAGCAQRFAQQLGLDEAHAAVMEYSGALHDAGKADRRFQAWLHGGNQRIADAFPRLLAKSIGPALPKRERDLARERAGYPGGGRHELLSVRLAELDGALPADTPARELILHLIASHHGYCRPFAPVVEDRNPVNAAYLRNGSFLSASSATHLERLDSGVADRFWTLIRRFGWWGLPWLEAVLRLADWAVSEAAERENRS